MSLEVMAIINFIQNKIKDLEEEKKRYGDPNDSWDEVNTACDLKIDAYRDILDYAKQLK